MEMDYMLRMKIEEKVDGIPRAKLIKSAENISNKYRSESGKGERLVSDEIDTITYAAVRMPATFAAVSSAMKYTMEIENFEIKTVLDIGAGTGTVAWVVSEMLESWESITCIEREPSMIKLGKSLMEGNPFNEKVNWVNSDMNSFNTSEKYDLVIASYSLNELSEQNRISMVEKLWGLTNKVLLIVEPGTPAAFSQLKNIRKFLIDNGGHVVAPCPHSLECNLGDDDWCHFTCRVSRSKLHKLLKGGEVPYEDEKFSYIAVSKNEVSNSKSRILRHPLIASGRITLRICTEKSLETINITKKQKTLFKFARKAKCGDAFVEKDEY